MSDIVERVARAIYASRHSSIHWDDASDWTQGEMLTYAHAAMAAMREPTPDMYIAGGIAFADRQRALAGDLESTIVEPVCAAWEAMIDEALKP